MTEASTAAATPINQQIKQQQQQQFNNDNNRNCERGLTLNNCFIGRSDVYGRRFLLIWPILGFLVLDGIAIALASVDGVTSDYLLFEVFQVGVCNDLAVAVVYFLRTATDLLPLLKIFFKFNIYLLSQ